MAKQPKGEGMPVSTHRGDRASGRGPGARGRAARTKGATVRSLENERGLVKIADLTQELASIFSDENVEPLSFEDAQIAHRRVKIMDLMVDPAAQRAKFYQNWALFLAQRFHRAFMGAVIVSQRPDGTLIMLDGMHRVVAAATRGETEVSALVISGLHGASEEAAFFESFNVNHKPTHPWDIYRARRIQGDETVRKIDGMLASHGLSAVGGPGTVGGVNAPSILLEMANRDYDRMARVFDLLTMAYGAGASGITSRLLTAMERIVKLHDGQFEDEAMAAAIRTLTPEQWAKRAQSTDAPSHHLYQAIVDEYNDGVRTHNKRLRADLGITGQRGATPGGRRSLVPPKKRATRRRRREQDEPAPIAA